MTIEISVESRDNMKVDTESRNGKKFAIRLEGITLYFDRKDLEELEDMIESELWDESEHRDTLSDKVDELKLVVSELLEKLENEGIEAEGYLHHAS